ncbi:MAG: hypothetical protein QOJ16_1719 [Acidobacteriota bacterium]|jgi:hypothetical protein|nr:hypothetical protein [Acidobacteriota bacterium]
MLNLAGSSFDFGQVLFAILTECEHRRRSLEAEEAEEKLTQAAREKLAEIHESYVECGGTEDYFEDLTREILETAIPQYVPRAIAQTRLEREGYDLWRAGDPVARAAFGLLGLLLGGLLVALPFVPIWEDSFAFLLALAGFLFPEITRLFYDQRHSRFLNRMIKDAERYQKDRRVHYLSSAKFDQALSTMFEEGQGSAEEAKSAAEVAETPVPRPKPRAKTLGH